MAAAELQALAGRVQALEAALQSERKQHIANLREIASASGLREAHAMSLLAAKTRDSDQQPNGGPGMSPTDMDSRGPPRGAQDPQPSPSPSSSKLDRWLSRSKQSDDGNSNSSHESPGSEASPAPQSKLDRWLARSQSKEEPESKPKSKLDRWLARSNGDSASPASCPAATPQGSWQAPSTEQGLQGQQAKEVDELLARIRGSWSTVDSALALVQEDRSSESKGNGMCHRCGGMSDDCPPGAKRDGGDWSSAKEGTKMGIRMEEKSRGLTVTHVVPGGQGDKAGIQVKDVIRTLNGRPVKSLKSFGQQAKEGGEVVCLEVIRGSGVNHRQLTIYSRTRPPSPGEEQGSGSGSGGEGEEKGEQQRLLERFLKERRTERDKEKEVTQELRRSGQEKSPGAGAVGARPKSASQKAFNKYGKDTKLWVPECDEGHVELPGASDRPTKEIGGFFMFPPGHPDHVPLPPGEAALIAGRSDVHPMERLAPHWSHIIFVSPSGAEIRAQARHATYGTIEDISGKMVHADPLTAHTDLANSDAVRGSVAYIKRGGAPFTKKARVAVAAGAIACVVANTDRETFGMSYTDDGLPFAALNIPCVMISSDIVSKLEASEEWSVTLVPAKPEQQGTKRPPPPVPRAAGAAAVPKEPASPPATQGQGLQGLETLPLNPNGANLGKPGKKPTMWKKIKLMLP